MKYGQLLTQIQSPIFSRNDVLKLFPDEPENQINTQLHRLVKRGSLCNLKRGIYTFVDAKIDEFVIAGKLYTPSYVSLESALNIYGIIPDVVVNVTSVTTITSKKIATELGTFSYSKIRNDLFFGYTNIMDKTSGLYYQIATPEKALLDYIYCRKIKDLTAQRIDVSSLDSKALLKLATHFPKWVRKIVKNA